MLVLFLFLEKDSGRNNLIAPNTDFLEDNWYVKELRTMEEGDGRGGECPRARRL